MNTIKLIKELTKYVATGLSNGAYKDTVCGNNYPERLLKASLLLSEPQYLHMLEFKFFHNTLGVKGIMLKSHRFEQSIIIPWDYEKDELKEIAKDWLKANKFEIVSYGMGKDSLIFNSSKFEPIK